MQVITSAMKHVQQQHRVVQTDAAGDLGQSCASKVRTYQIISFITSFCLKSTIVSCCLTLVTIMLHLFVKKILATGLKFVFPSIFLCMSVQMSPWPTGFAIPDINCLPGTYDLYMYVMIADD